MNRDEKKLLQATIKAVRSRKKWAWNELKREIWDMGYQSMYPSQLDFLPPIEAEVRKFPQQLRNDLIKAWRSATPSRDDLDDANFESAYTLLILEEIVERARVAAYRTVDWGW